MNARSKYFRGREPILTEFEILCKARGLKQGEIISDMIEKFVRENRTQTTLTGFPHERNPITGVFDKASVLVACSELERLLNLVEANDPDRERKVTFQLELAKALRVIEPVYRRTRDPKLGELLAQAEARLG